MNRVGGCGDGVLIPLLNFNTMNRGLRGTGIGKVDSTGCTVITGVRVRDSDIMTVNYNVNKAGEEERERERKMVGNVSALSLFSPL